MILSNKHNRRTTGTDPTKLISNLQFSSEYTGLVAIGVNSGHTPGVGGKELKGDGNADI